MPDYLFCVNRALNRNTTWQLVLVPTFAQLTTYQPAVAAFYVTCCAK